MKSIEPKTFQNNRYHFHVKIKQQKDSKEKLASLPKATKKRTTTKKPNTEVDKKTKETTKKKQSNSWIKTGLHSFKCPKCKKRSDYYVPSARNFQLLSLLRKET